MPAGAWRCISSSGERRRAKLRAGRPGGPHARQAAGAPFRLPARRLLPQVPAWPRQGGKSCNALSSGITVCGLPRRPGCDAGAALGMSVAEIVLKRLAIGLATLAFVSLLVFAGTEILPGDVANAILGQAATP